MNILFLTSSLPRFTNDGQVPFVLEQAVAWKRVRKEDSLFILAPHDVEAKRAEELQGIKILRFVYWWPIRLQKLVYPAILPNIKRNPFLIFQLPTLLISEFFNTVKLIKKHKIDLIFAHWVIPQGLISYLVSKITKVPYGLKNYSSDLRVLKKIPLFGVFLARKMIKNAKVMFCENSLLKSEALDCFGEKDQDQISSKIIVLSMGIRDLEKKGIKNPSEVYKYDFGFIGRLSKKKGIHYFIEALKIMDTDSQAPKVAIAGEGEEKNSLYKQKGDLDIDFIGFVSEDEKLNFFLQNKFLIFPSKNIQGDVEGMPVAMLEALYYGKIIIASKDTNINLLPEWESFKDNIIFIEDPNDTISFSKVLELALKLGSEDIEQRSSKLKKIFKKYNWETRIQDYIKPLISS